MNRLLIFILLVSPFLTYGEEINPRLFDYSKVDAEILSVNKNQFKSIGNLSKFINTKFSTDHDRLRAIFRSVTDNIEYSFAYKNADVNQVFQARKAVCNGYSELIKILCDNSKITCRKIVGLAKNDVEFADNLDYKHAWNIVTLYDKYYFIEATWAAGSFDKEKGKFTKDFRNEYFLTKPEVFILQHFPDNPEDQLLKEIISKSFFLSCPIFMTGAVANELTSFTPQNFLIKTKYKFGYEFALTSLKNITGIGIAFSLKGISDGMYEPIEFEKNKNDYSFWYPFERYGKYYAIISVNGQEAIIYKVNIE